MLEFGTTEELLQHYEAVNHRICVEAPTKYVEKTQRKVKYRPSVGSFQPEEPEGTPEPVPDRCDLDPLYFTTKNVIRRIIARCEKDAGLKPGMIMSKDRRQNTVEARHAAICEAYQKLKPSLVGLGKNFGLDHTTVLYSLRKHGFLPWGNSPRSGRRREFSTGATKRAISPSENVHFEVINRPQV